MFKFNQPYINLGSNKISIAGVPSIYKTSDKTEKNSKEFAGRKLIAAILIATSVSMVSLQTGFVLNASAEGNPISSPLSSEESPAPSSSDSPITAPEVSPSPTPSDNPVTSPEVTPTPTPSAQPSDNGGNSGGGSSNNGGGSGSASCNNEAPKAPRISSAVTSGKNEITLNWEKPAGNVTHYSISYGLMKGKPLYGNPNIGNVTSFTVKGLAGGVNYFFTVKAVNDCTPSEASNEVAVKVGGKFINTLAAVGFKPAVNGVNVSGKTVKFQGTTTASKPVSGNTLVHITESEGKTINTGLVGKVINFFKGLF